MAFNFLRGNQNLMQQDADPNQEEADQMTQALGRADLRRNLPPWALASNPPPSPVRGQLGYEDSILPQDNAPSPGGSTFMSRLLPPDTGPAINNAGILSNANNQVSGTSPFRGASTLSSGGLGLLGYEAGPNGNLRPLGIANGNPLMQVQDLIDQASARGPSFDLNSQSGIDAMNQFRDASTARAQGHIGSLLQNQLGQNQLDLQRTMQLGTPGVPGAMQNAASDSLNRTRENERYGPEARYDAFYNQAYNSFPPGTPHEARVRQMRQSGMAPPQFLTGGQQRPGSPGGIQSPGQAGITPRQAPGEDTNASAVDNAFEMGVAGFPLNPATQQRQLPDFASNPSTATNAITETMRRLSTQQLADPAVQNRLITQFGPQAMNQWYNRSNSLLNRFMPGGEEHQAQIDRALQATGGSRSPVNPLSSHAPTWERYLGGLRYSNPVTAVPTLMQQYGALPGVR